MRYPGGNGRCYQRLISMIPPHHTCIETHLGGGAVVRHKRPAEFIIGVELDERVVDRWRAMTSPATTVVHGAALDFLATHDFAGDELVYYDPPYPKEARARPRLYRHDYGREDHVRLLDRLRRLPCMVIVSSYNNPLYAEALEDWRVVRFPDDSHTGPRVETAWLNFLEPTMLHDFDHASDDFRGRERLRCRRSGLSRRIESLPGTERNALLRDLAQRFGSELRAAMELAS